MGRRTDLVASACLLAFALIMFSFDLSVSLSTGDWLNWQTYAVWIGLVFIVAFLFVWTWRKPTPGPSTHARP